MSINTSTPSKILVCTPSLSHMALYVETHGAMAPLKPYSLRRRAPARLSIVKICASRAPHFLIIGAHRSGALQHSNTTDTESERSRSLIKLIDRNDALVEGCAVRTRNLITKSGLGVNLKDTNMKPVVLDTGQRRST